MGIGGGELVVIGIAAFLWLGQLGAVIGLAAWGRWVARHAEGRAFRVAAWLPVVGLVLQLLGTCGSAAGMALVFQSIESADAAQRATLLARGISEVMNLAACPFCFGLLLYAISVVTFAIATARIRSAQRAR